MRFRITAPIAVLLAVQIMASCGDPTGAGALWPRYVLISVDGAPLPFVSADVTFADGRHLTRRVVADTIRLLNETDFRRSVTQYEDFFPVYPPETFQFFRDGTYMLESDVLTTYWTGIGLPPGGGTEFESYAVLSGGLRIQRHIGPYCAEPAQPCAGTERMVDFVYAAR